MVLIDHYVRLAQHLFNEETAAPIRISLEEVSQILHCTPRNAKLILKKLVDENLIVWSSGKGRGNRSTVVLLIQPQELVLGKAKELVFHGEISEARGLIDHYLHAFPQLQEQFLVWIRNHFGFHIEQRELEAIDTLRIPLDHPLPKLDPANISLRSENHLIKQICDTLVRLNVEKDLIEPHLAFAWESNQEHTVWTFLLRKGVYFHHGQKLTAHDVKYTFDRIADKKVKSPYRWMVRDIKEVRVLDERVVEVTLHRPNHLFLHFVGNERLSILPNGLMEHKKASENHLLIGTGPFKLVRNDQSMVVLEAFETYFRERAYLDRIEFWIMPSTSQHFDLHYQTNPDYQDKTQAGDKRKWQLTKRLDKSVQYLSLNVVKEGPLRDSQFRNALSMIIDRSLLIQEVGGIRKKMATGLITQDEEVSHSDHSSDEIQHLLSQSGHGEILHLYTFDDEDHVEDANWIQKQCEKFGIMLELHFCEPDVLLQAETIEKADIIHDSATVDDWWEFSFLDLLLSKNSFVHNHLDDEGIEYIQEQTYLRVFPCEDKEERHKQLRLLEQYVLEKKQLIPLYQNEIRILSHADFQEISLTALGWVDFRYMWKAYMLTNLQG
ncbi:ABC transporter substrate-binding protein [Brevibacillus sp. SYSU BS000544]|uniref:SgrR family transcriptional regulator n=1 Tax=Brevibacillus sp. SYSU BS000544 TaxID=3416443 RepID=UPI003CE47743